MARKDAAELLDALTPALLAAANNVVRHAYGPPGLPRGTRSAAGEDLAVPVGDLLRRADLRLALHEQACRQPPRICGLAPLARGPLSNGPRTHAPATPAGAWPPGGSPPATAPAAGGIFPPQPKSPGLDRTGYGLALPDKIL
jgi:hypothetical protein